jgi:hypothetical protein
MNRTMIGATPRDEAVHHTVNVMGTVVTETPGVGVEEMNTPGVVAGMKTAGVELVRSIPAPMVWI